MTVVVVVVVVANVEAVASGGVALILRSHFPWWSGVHVTLKLSVVEWCWCYVHTFPGGVVLMSRSHFPWWSGVDVTFTLSLVERC